MTLDADESCGLSFSQTKLLGGQAVPRYAFHPSAEKRGYSHGEVVDAWESWIEQAWLDADMPGRLLRIGIDGAGRSIEVVGVCFDEGARVLFIHAMPLRKATVRLVRSAKER